MIVLKDKKYVDKQGDPIYFKEPYFDQGFRRKFNSIQEKHKFMTEHNAISTGDSDAKIKIERNRHAQQEKERQKKRS